LNQQPIIAPGALVGLVRQRSGAAMNARSWTSWMLAALLTSSLSAADEAAKSSINYSLAENSLPAPAFLKSVKPSPTQVPTWAPKGDAASKPTIEVKTAQTQQTASKTPTQTTSPTAKNIESSAPLLPIDPPVVKAPPVETKELMPVAKASKIETAVAKPVVKPSVVEPAFAKPVATAVDRAVTPVAAYLPTADDHMKCLECLKVLSSSPIESDRKAALVEMANLQAWKHMKSAYMVLRRVALTEYNTKMRADAVKLFGEAMTEHALAADTLKLSAQYDSDAGIRASAFAQLEKLAAMPPDRVTR